ncbi:MAG: hypothetical protein ABW092_16695 [Candidatus Thiodiazotropha sp.]
MPMYGIKATTLSWIYLLLSFSLSLLTACGSNPSVDTPDYTVRPVAIAACDGRGPGSEACHFRLMWNPAECYPGKPCDRLVVFWAGGNQVCDDVDINNQGHFDPLLRHYVDRGFVAACAQPYTTGDAGGAYPYHREWDRMHYLMQRLRIDSSALWDGSHLLISGSSHGGTAPMVVIANNRALKDYASVWTGSSHTAVIMFDGISNPRRLEEWAGSQRFGSGCALLHRRWVGRYGDGSPLRHSCGNGACYCASPAHISDWIMDTLPPGASDPTSPYTCEDFVQESKSTLYRFVSCSGLAGAPACAVMSGDIVPDDQQSELYAALKGCSGITASHVRYECPHILCGGFNTRNNCGGDDAVEWLLENGW